MNDFTVPEGIQSCQKLLHVADDAVWVCWIYIGAEIREHKCQMATFIPEMSQNLHNVVETPSIPYSTDSIHRSVGPGESNGLALCFPSIS